MVQSKAVAATAMSPVLIINTPLEIATHGGSRLTSTSRKIHGSENVRKRMPQSTNRDRGQ